MKNVIVILILCGAMMICAGCVGSQMIWEKFDPATQNRTGKLVVQDLAGMVNKHIGLLKLTIIIEDGNDKFKGSLLVADHNIVESPASARALGMAVADGFTGGGATAMENLTDPNRGK